MVFNKEVGLGLIFRVADFRSADHSSEGRFLFQQLYYLQHQQSQPCLRFDLWNERQQESLIVLHLFVSDAQAVSPWRATFGGIDTHSETTPELLDLFLHQLDLFLITQSITLVSLTQPPFAYDYCSARYVTAALLRNGYNPAIAETNYHIPVTAALLETRLHPSERRRLRKCHQARIVFREETKPNLSHMYAFIRQARLRKGFRMSLDEASFVRLFADMPKVYRIFTARQDDQIAALTVTVRINADILYNFYPADHPAFLNLSPTVLLTSELYAVAQREGYTMLDLGIATEQGQPNQGLMRFKSHLGGIPSLRLTFRKRLA